MIIQASDFVDHIHVNTELTHTSLHVLYMHLYHMEMSVNKIIVFYHVKMSVRNMEP